jgi:hypothetical protein
MSAINILCRRFSTWQLTIAVMLVASGCGGGNGSVFSGARYPVKGKVMLVDGKPVASGKIYFKTDAPPLAAAADIGSDGAFEFKEGLAEAKYRVHVSPATPEGTKTALKQPYASKYMDDEDSGLTAPVTSDESKNQFEFKLETKDTTERTSRGSNRGR